MILFVLLCNAFAHDNPAEFSLLLRNRIMNTGLQLWRLQLENRILRLQLLLATSSCYSCIDSEASCQDVIQLPEAEEHRMANRHAWTPPEQLKDDAASF